jgi:hypothetical protein
MTDAAGEDAEEAARAQAAVDDLQRSTDSWLAVFQVR